MPRVVSVSRNLANRARLSEDLERTDADVYLVEIKAAAIDLVAVAAQARGVQVVFAENEVVSPELDDAILGLVPAGARAYESSAPLGAAAARHARTPVLEGTDGAGAGRSRRPARAGVRAREADRPGSDRARGAERRARAGRGARDRGAGRGAGLGGDAAAAPLPGASGARPAGDRPRRRRDRHGQVDGCDRGGVPPRDHAGHVDGLRPADDARVLLEGIHAVDPLLELRGRCAACASRNRRRPRHRRFPRADTQCDGRRAGIDRARARGGLVDGARGRAPRPGDAAARSTARSSSSACLQSTTKRSTARTSWCETPGSTVFVRT